jgi:hypothetical protein
MTRPSPPAFVRLACLFAASGCATLTNFESAKTLKQGGWQVAIEGRVLRTGSSAAGETQLWPAVAVRRGMTDRFELGLRAGGRPEVFAKFQLRDGERVAIAFSQTLGLWRWDTTVSQWQGWSRSALPIGVSFGAHELVMSPGVHLALGRTDEGVVGFIAMPSASVGFIWRPLKWLGFMPQVTVGASAVQLAQGITIVGGGVALEGGLAVIGGGLEGW